MTEPNDNGYRTKLHQAPTVPVQLGGVPRDLCIMWWSLIMAALLAGTHVASDPAGHRGALSDEAPDQA